MDPLTLTCALAYAGAFLILFAVELPVRRRRGLSYILASAGIAAVIGGNVLGAREAEVYGYGPMGTACVLAMIAGFAGALLVTHMVRRVGRLSASERQQEIHG